LFVLLFVVGCSALLSRHPNRGAVQQKYESPTETPLIGKCQEKWFEQQVDHFGWDNKDTFLQRYFICDEYWGGDTLSIWFYTGNEADVTLYLNASGLMWENAPKFEALLIFAEHRYFGQSLPYGDETPKKMNWLSSEQALADYATLIRHLKETLKAPHSPVIAFGGSYGGMLASWLRMKYPSAVAGAIAGSAPIWAFLGQDPAYDIGIYAKIETADATPPCQRGVRAAWPIISTMAQTADGRKQLQSIFRTCDDLKDTATAMELYNWASSAIAFLAMGDYPYSTSYMTNGGCALPAYPMNVGCAGFKDGQSQNDILAALRDMAGVFYNCSGDLKCFHLTQSVNNETKQDGLFWDYLWCTEMVIPSSQDGVNDMFWNAPWNIGASSEWCAQLWNVIPRPFWATINYGGKNLNGISNIFFSNGKLDPWHGGGVLSTRSGDIGICLMDGAAHHLDFMFSNPLDPKSVLDCRKAELDHIKKWIYPFSKEGRAANRHL